MEDRLQRRWRQNGTLSPPATWRPGPVDDGPRTSLSPERRHRWEEHPELPPRTSMPSMPRMPRAEPAPRSQPEPPRQPSQPRVVHIEPGREEEVKAFAKNLERFGKVAPVDQETLDYARMDLSAMLVYMSRGKEGLLKELQACVMRRDMDSFIEAIDRGGVGTRADINELKAALQRGDQEGAANVIRRLGRPSKDAQEEQRRRTHGPEQYLKEVANHTDTAMGTNRRIKTDLYLTGNAKEPKMFRRPPGMTFEAPVVMGTLELGEAAMVWEKDQQLHPWILVGANVAGDLSLEANGTMTFDGRLNGDSTTGWKAAGSV